jgi:hypothetical protein
MVHRFSIMKNKESLWIIIIGMVIGGISYWFNDYNVMNISGISIYLIMSAGSLFGAMLIAFKLNVKPLKCARLISFGVILSVLIRILFDTTFVDSTSHNLAPFEIIIAAAIAFPCAIIGAYLASFQISSIN